MVTGDALCSQQTRAAETATAPESDNPDLGAPPPGRGRKVITARELCLPRPPSADAQPGGLSETPWEAGPAWASIDFNQELHFLTCVLIRNKCVSLF